MAGLNGNQSWIWPSMLGLVAGLFSAYISIQFAVEQRLSKIEGASGASTLRLSVIDGWIVRTESNRFTLRDGENLKQRLQNHSARSGHGVVVERLAEMEARLRNLERRNSDAIEQ